MTQRVFFVKLLVGDAIVLPSHHNDLAVIGWVSEHFVCSLLGP